KDIRRFQKDVENKIQLSLLNQETFYYMVHMSSLVIFAFIKSAGYSDIANQIRKLSEQFNEKHDQLDDYKRYDIAKSGFKDVFSHFVPHFQEHKSPTATMLHILSRYDDYSIKIKNGEQNLLKIQFLAKNLVLKEDKWEEHEKFRVSHGIHPHESTKL